MFLKSVPRDSFIQQASFDNQYSRRLASRFLRLHWSSVCAVLRDGWSLTVHLARRWPLQLLLNASIIRFNWRSEWAAACNSWTS